MLFAVLVVASTAVKIAAGAIARLPLASGLLATAEMGVPAAVASLGLATNTFRPGQAAAIMGAAAVSLAVASIGATRLAPGSSVNPHAPDAGG
jgi:hypothetical protein